MPRKVVSGPDYDDDYDDYDEYDDDYDEYDDTRYGNDQHPVRRKKVYFRIFWLYPYHL